jgi:hypothetical protein
MTIIEINRKYYSVPEKWNELSSRQLLQVMHLFYRRNYPIEKAALKLIKILTGMSWWAFFRAPLATTEKQFYPIWKLRGSIAKWLFRNRHECIGLEEYLYLVNFLVEQNDLTRQLLPSYKGFYGPSDECGNMRGVEFVFSEHYYMDWAANEKDEKLLNNLVAVLYRPRKEKYDHRMNKDGDCRIAFNENLCEWYATTVIYHWPLHVKAAIAKFYGACREKWVKDNEDLFGGAGEPAKYGLLSVMRDVAKSGVHGNFEAVEQLYVPMIMIELNEQMEEVKRHEKAIKGGKS